MVNVGEGHKEKRKENFQAHIWVFIRQFQSTAETSVVSWVELFDGPLMSNGCVNMNETPGIYTKYNYDTKVSFLFTKLTDPGFSGKFSSCSFLFKAKVLQTFYELAATKLK